MAVSTNSTAPRPRRDISEAVIRGVSRRSFKDIYFTLIRGSWARLFAVFALVFLSANAFFAVLYMLQPGAIGNASGHFVDAFAFSVQTMATIGYGTLTPHTHYADAIVTMEACLSIVGTAVVTGLVFAKASRPTAGVLFSTPLCVTRMNGKPVLTFRMGNSRGNEVVDATVDVSAVVNTTTTEGLSFRRIFPLALQRHRSPVFVLTWSVHHDLNEASPLYDIDWKGELPELQAIVITLIGHDGTYGQTIYARHIYYPEDVRVNEHFVDVISDLDDGRLLVDYSRFHQTEPDKPV